ncbi:MAG: class I SAM-dependent methyltransferase [Candidatus Omnitrophica bacterium]|nr:class I SAM-dependent methyltransferase [Candidatus Omnitrophota bacterium]
MTSLSLQTIKEVIKEKFIGTQYEWESHIENVIRLFNDNLRFYQPHNMLDVGFGSGDRTLRIAKYFRMDMQNVYGIDYNSQHVVSCNNTFNTKIVDLEIGWLPYEDNSFDLVICNQVLEHLKNFRKVIDEITRVTKVKGYFVLGIPNLAHLINRIYLLFGIQPLCINLNSSHVRGFTHKSFVELLNSINNVKLVDFKGSLMYPLPYPLAKLLSQH